jgi:hypothetical protein
VMQFVLLYMMIFLPPAPGASAISWIPFPSWYENNVPQALYSIALVVFFNVNLYKVSLLYQSSFHHFCHAFFATYPFSVEFAVSDVAPTSFVLSWVQTAAKYKMTVVEYVVQVNEIFIGRLEATENGMWVSGLEPGETYRVRVWARIESAWYPSRCTVIKTMRSSMNPLLLEMNSPSTFPIEDQVPSSIQPNSPSTFPTEGQVPSSIQPSDAESCFMDTAKEIDVCSVLSELNVPKYIKRVGNTKVTCFIEERA